MPFPNEHAARLKSPGRYSKFRRQNEKFGKGIDAIFGVTQDGRVELQAIRFAADKFTPEQARTWLKEHDHKATTFEAAAKKGDSEGMEEVKRYDKLEALPGSIKRTDEGFLQADPIVTRTGVFSYRLPDGTVRKEFRCDEEVFCEDALKSAQMIPITDTHPSDFVTPENAQELAIGMTGENARRDGSTVRVPIKITTEAGIAAVEGGRLQLSLGYRCLLERKDGEYEGEAYTHIQRQIRCNHLALCDKARAGAQATLRLDTQDAVMVETGQDRSGSRKEKTKMPGTVKLDSSGISYEVPPEVAAEFETIRKDRDDAAGKLTEETAAKDALQAKHDALAEKVEKLEKIDNAAAIAEGVKTRVALVEKVKPMVSEEIAAKFDGMTDSEIRIEGIKSQVEKFDAEGKSDDYLAARFDAAVEAFEKSEKEKEGSQVVGKGTRKKDAEDEDPDVARQKMIEKADAAASGKDKDKE
jgi:hypothetical protein